MDEVTRIPAEPAATPLGSEAAARGRDSLGAPARAEGLPAEGSRHATAIRVVSVLATLALWEWFGRDVNPIFFSYPTAIFETVPGMLRSGELVDAFLSSMLPFAIGFASAIVTGVLLGLLMGRYWLVEKVLEAQITALYSTPNVALIPLVILWFGLGAKAKVVIVILAAVFPILINTYDGVRNVSRGFVEIGQAEGASSLQIFGKIILPASLPFIMSGIRLSIGRAVVGIVVAEMFTAITGLGGAIVYYGNQFATAKLLVIVIVLSLLGVVLTQGARVMERRLAMWKETERAR
jgi:NitT/TauT family transport system permease protein